MEHKVYKNKSEEGNLVWVKFKARGQSPSWQEIAA